MTSNVLENIKSTTQASLDSLNAWDIDALEAIRSDDFIFQGLPLSLGQKPLNNEQFRGMFLHWMTPAFQSFRIEPHTRMHDPETRQATVYSTVSIETAAGPASHQIVQMMKFDKTGEKITRLDEYFDSKFFIEMSEKMNVGTRPGDGNEQ